MTGVELLLVVVCGWIVLGVITATLVAPLLRTASRAERTAQGVGEIVASAGTVTDGGTALTTSYGRRWDPRVVSTRPAAPASLRESGYPSIVLERLTVHACSVLRADRACILVRDRGGKLVPAAGAGLDPDLIGRAFELDGGPIGTALQTGHPVVVAASHEIGREGGVPWARGAAVAPVWVGGSLRGALWVADSGGAPGIELSQLPLLGELAQLVGHALAHHESRELSAADPQVEIDGLLRMLKRAEPETAGQVDRVADLAARLGEELDLTAPERIELELAARLHDVGKLRVPPAILAKRAALTEAEWEVVRLHPLWGAEMVAAIPGLEAVALLVRLHHERHDARGYPDGLGGERIPMASRIVALCDAFAAMTTDRPYRRALDAGAALNELGAAAGSQFDPRLVDRLAVVARRTPAHTA